MRFRTIIIFERFQHIRRRKRYLIWATESVDNIVKTINIQKKLFIAKVNVTPLFVQIGEHFQ